MACQAVFVAGDTFLWNHMFFFLLRKKSLWRMHFGWWVMGSVEDIYSYHMVLAMELY